MIDINTDGRIQLDLFAHVQKHHRLKDYSLNYVFFHFVGDKK